MTTEMVRTILRLALERLLATALLDLQTEVPWLRAEHIQWCLTYLGEMTLSPEDLYALRMVRDMHQLLDDRSLCDPCGTVRRI
jgi:hypothetical protein